MHSKYNLIALDSCKTAKVDITARKALEAEQGGIALQCFGRIIKIEEQNTTTSTQRLK